MKKHLVTFEPSGKNGYIESGKSLLQAARELGVTVNSACGGKLVCSRCAVLIDQDEALKGSSGSSPASLSDVTEQERGALARRGLNDSYRLACAARILGDVTAYIPKESQAQRQITYKTIREIRTRLKPGVRKMMEFDVRPTLRKVKCPVLALNGGKDCQVPPKENLQGIEEALKAGGNQHYAIKELPNLNHLFQTVQPGGETDYGKIEETMSPIVLKIISDWVLEQTTGKIKEMHLEDERTLTFEQRVDGLEELFAIAGQLASFEFLISITIPLTGLPIVDASNL
jgi:ferredoxin